MTHALTEDDCTEASRQPAAVMPASSSWAPEVKGPIPSPVTKGAVMCRHMPSRAVMSRHVPSCIICTLFQIYIVNVVYKEDD